MYRLLCALFLALGITAGVRYRLAPAVQAAGYSANDVCYSAAHTDLATSLTVTWDNPAGIISAPTAVELMLSSPPAGWVASIHSAGWSWANLQHTGIVFTGTGVYKSTAGGSVLIRNRISVNTFNTITRSCP